MKFWNVAFPIANSTRMSISLVGVFFPPGDRAEDPDPLHAEVLPDPGRTLLQSPEVVGLEVSGHAGSGGSGVFVGALRSG